MAEEQKRRGKYDWLDFIEKRHSARKSGNYEEELRLVREELRQKDNFIDNPLGDDQYTRKDNFYEEAKRLNFADDQAAELARGPVAMPKGKINDSLSPEPGSDAVSLLLKHDQIQAERGHKDAQERVSLEDARLKRVAAAEVEHERLRKTRAKGRAATILTSTLSAGYGGFSASDSLLSEDI